MSKQSPISSNNGRWIVDFALRIVSEEQRQAVDALGINRIHDVVRLWLTVLAPPRSSVLDPLEEPIRRIVFPNRASARRFKMTWGGRIIPPTSGLTPTV